MILYYLFDPLCGWCYGANPAIHYLAKKHTLHLIPTGLFAENNRIMDQDFAQHAWTNDTRIMNLTGQPFSENYRKNVLQQPGKFNSFAITTVLTAITQTYPKHELEVLSTIYTTRYVDGQNTSEIEVLTKILEDLNLTDIIPLLQDENIINATRQRIMRGKQLAQSLGISGVPQLAANLNGNIQLLNNQLLYQKEPKM